MKLFSTKFCTDAPFWLHRRYKYPFVKIHKENLQQDAIMYQNNLLFHTYIKLNMFGATHRPSSEA